MPIQTSHAVRMRGHTASPPLGGVHMALLPRRHLHRTDSHPAIPARSPLSPPLLSHLSLPFLTPSLTPLPHPPFPSLLPIHITIQH
uniref:Uncharacterized protein n=1 Tax=Knipowitschia caucasica TaxID=637954 RepID=A0AAV2KA36_KNICA